MLAVLSQERRNVTEPWSSAEGVAFIHGHRFTHARETYRHVIRQHAAALCLISMLSPRHIKCVDQQYVL